ncbi:hypothetical protein HDU77_009780 [Chytriomyces hyalinus]|nr:hypothetical protein HDU77_009780 [Chytriomyces hyalinus]
MKRQRTAPNSESKRNAATPRAVSDALPVPPPETNTAATLAIILNTLEKMQATMSSMQTEVTDIKQSQLSIISSQRGLSKQVLDLQKHKEKLVTSLRDLPFEIIVRIFAWIPVRTACQTVAAQALAALGTRLNGLEYHNVEKGIPNSISCLTAVEELYLESCALIGEIPDAFGAFKNLTNLTLPRNSLTGALPSSLNLLSALKHLDLAGNQLSGDFPPLPNLNSLVTLFIGRNCFTGPVPTVFGDPRKMTQLHADQNRFSVIPASIGQPTNLEELAISGNRFLSEIPSELWNLGSLTYLEMSDCNMSGSLAGVGNLRKLETLDLSNNRFSGEFPSRIIYNLPLLDELHLVGNQFSGGKVLDMSLRNIKMTMCMDREFQRKYVIRQGFHKCHEEHGVVPFTGDIFDSDAEDKSDIGRT